jgi:hypothetical protein
VLERKKAPSDRRNYWDESVVKLQALLLSGSEGKTDTQGLKKQLGHNAINNLILGDCFTDSLCRRMQLESMK